MAGNQKIYQHQRAKNKNVMIIEVGNLKRNTLWRISYNNINRQGIFGNDLDLDESRPKKIGCLLESLRIKRKPQILIATQHGRSLQWEGMPAMEQWVERTVRQIKQYTDRKIIIRQHPRFPLRCRLPDCIQESPMKIAGSYDDFNIDYNYHCVINHNSGPGVQAVISGVPVSVDTTSLAYDVSFPIEKIEEPWIPDRSDWFLKLCHTEWTLDEISAGIPFERLLKLS
jgi:hypothetical protein